MDGRGEAECVRVEGLASGGEGVGRLSDGRVVFIEGAIPGDRVELADLEVGRKLARARVARLIEPSPDRVEPRCSSFGACGGCCWQGMRYPAQLEAKRTILRDALRRIGGIDSDLEIDVTGSPDAYAYRARARLVEGDTGIGYRRRGSHEVEPVEACPILVPAAQEALRDLVQSGKRSADPERSSNAAASGKRTRKRRSAREWIVSAGTSGPAIATEVRPKRVKSAARASIVIEVLGERLVASATSFIQGNALLHEALAEEVLLQCTQRASGKAPARFVELYSGIGFFTLPLARRGLSGVAIEGDRVAVADLRRNLAKAGLGRRVGILTGRIERRGDLAKRFGEADLLLVDPPRTGLEGRVRDAIASAGPTRLVYVSCDPPTLARDLRILIAAGYSLESIRALDLFPQTPHVETVVRLERNGSGLDQSMA